jgi:hypothetical protein
MRAQNPGVSQNKRILADVGVPHPVTDGRLHCHFRPYSAKVSAGRTQAVYLSQRGTWGNKPPAFQEYWSRGCRRAHVSFSVFACWPLWQLAHLKKSQLPTCQSRFPPNRPTRASTSNTTRRADQHCLTRHATPTPLDQRHHFSRLVRFAQSSSRDLRIISVCRNDQPVHLFRATTTVLKLRKARTQSFQTNAQITRGGLSALLQAMLKPAAVPFMQDRSTC